MANLTPEQFEKALNNAKQALQANMGKILVNASSIGSAEMQRRVFNRGLTTAGKRMEYRNAPSNYTNLRLDAGLQISYKDLTFTGNLFYSMNILSTAEKEVTYGFNNSDTAQIAEWQQTSDKQVNEPIFELNEKEKAKMEKQMALDAYAILQSAIDNFPSVPTAKTIQKRDAVSKSISRQQQKKAKQRKFERKQALKNRVATAQKSGIKRRTSLDAQKNRLIKSDLKTSSIIKKREALQQQLKAKQKLINAKQKEINKKALQKFNNRKSYLESFIQRKQGQADIYALKLDKVKSGSKSAKDLSQKYLNAKKQIDKARKELYTSKFTAPTKKTNPVQKRLDAQKTKLAQSRASYKSQATRYQQTKKSVSQKAREQQRKLRAKQLRMGTYKPKKRKKK
jgi:hypothetical protein